MATRKEALQELLEKVEAGELPEPIFHGSSSIKGHWAYDTGLSEKQRTKVFLAYNGSLDAAKALHEAVLLGYNIGLMNKVNSGGWAALVYPKGPKSSEWVTSDTPARAWLTAIIKALIAQEPT